MDIEFGRILLCKVGYQGTAEYIAATAGAFDAKLREALLAALAANLGHPLPVVAVPRGKSSKRVELTGIHCTWKPRAPADCGRRGAEQRHCLGS